MASRVEIRIAGGMSEVGAKNGMIVASGREALVIDWGQKIPNHESAGGRWDAAARDNGDLPDDHYPDSSLLEGLRVSAICVTHGHLDHIGGLRKVQEMYPDAPVVTDRFTERVIRMHGIKAQHSNFPRVISNEDVEVGPFRIHRFPVNHSIPGASGFLLEVGGQRIVHLGDFKSWPVLGGHDKNEEIFGALAARGKIGLVFTDGTNAMEPGSVVHEHIVTMELAALLMQERGRIFFATVSSNSERLASVIQCAQSQGRAVYVVGSGMVDFLEMAEVHGWNGVSQKSNRITGERVLEPGSSSWPDSAVICVTGSQGEQDSFLGRLAEGWIPMARRSGDVLIVSQDTIPLHPIEARFSSMGGMLSARFDRVILTKDTPHIETQGAKIIRDEHLHSSGHARQGELMKVLDLLGVLGRPDPGIVVPVHADLEKRACLARLVQERGGEAELIEDGEILAL